MRESIGRERQKSSPVPYVESPQIAEGRDRHQLLLRSECPNCGARFKVPALWADGWCQRFFLRFEAMTNFQKPIV